MKNKTGPKPQPIEERFWRFVRKPDGPGDACWEWTGASNYRGYGVLGRSHDGKWRNVGAHRLAWELANGRPIPPGMDIMHTCDNPVCVRPDHLRQGTRAENMADCKAKGRTRTGNPRGSVCRWGHGETNGSAKLTEEAVRAIRAACEAGESQWSVGARHGLSQAYVGDIAKRRAWKHLA